MNIKFIHREDVDSVPQPVDALYIYVPFDKESAEALAFCRTVEKAITESDFDNPVRLPFYERLHTNTTALLERHGIACHLTLGERTILPLYGPNSKYPLFFIKLVNTLLTGLLNLSVREYSRENIAKAELEISKFSDSMRASGLDLSYTLPTGRIEPVIPFYSRNIKFSIDTALVREPICFCFDVQKGFTDLREFPATILRDIADIFKDIV